MQVGDDFLPAGREVPGVANPFEVRRLSGVEFSATDRRRETLMDCPLIEALSSWSRFLYDQGVRRVVHFSTYRPNARVGTSRRPSGHAHALAVDAARFVMEDGTEVDVLTGWGNRDRDRQPCDESAYSSDPRDQFLRKVLCAAVASNLFQVVVTPHRDQAHANHLHLEVVPGVEWSYVH